MTTARTGSVFVAVAGPDAYRAAAAKKLARYVWLVEHRHLNELGQSSS